MNRLKARKMGLLNQRGVALIEVLVVFFVLSIGLLGMAALQMRSMQYNQSAYMRSQAITAANDMMDQMRLNGGVVIAGGAGTQHQLWLDFIAGSLPSGVGATACDAGPPKTCTVTITWADRTLAVGNESLVVKTQM